MIISLLDINIVLKYKYSFEDIKLRTTFATVILVFTIKINLHERRI